MHSSNHRALCHGCCMDSTSSQPAVLEKHAGSRTEEQPQTLLYILLQASLKTSCRWLEVAISQHPNSASTLQIKSQLHPERGELTTHHVRNIHFMHRVATVELMPCQVLIKHMCMHLYTLPVGQHCRHVQINRPQQHSTATRPGPSLTAGNKCSTQTYMLLHLDTTAAGCDVGAHALLQQTHQLATEAAAVCPTSVKPAFAQSSNTPQCHHRSQRCASVDKNVSAMRTHQPCHTSGAESHAANNLFTWWW
jgi:hypothetical protein